jgi:hypothetical protein
MDVTDPVFRVALIYLVLQSPLVFYAAWFAPRLGARRPLWIALTAIPWVGLLFGYALILKGFCTVLDALERRNQLMSDEHMARRLGLASNHLEVPLARRHSAPRVSAG